MKLLRKVGATSEIWQIFIRDSSSTTGAGLTGLAFNTASLAAYYHRDTDTTATAITLVTMTVGTFTSSGFKEIDATNMPGWYQFCPPNAALASGAKSCSFHLKGATNMAPLPIEVDLDGQSDVTHWNGTAVSSPATAGIPDVNVKNINNVVAATPGAANGLFIAGSNAATTVAGLTTGALACTTITASGAVAFQSTFAVTTSTSLAALSATTVTFSGAVAFQSTFAVTTSTSLAALSCTTLTASGAVAFQSTFIVTGAVTFSSTFATTGTTTFNALTVTNATTLSGAVQLSSTLGITGAVTLSSTLTTGAVTLSALTVTNALLVSGTTTLAGAVAFSSTFAVAGTVTYNAFTITNAMLVSGTTTHTGAVTFTAGLTSNITGNITGNLVGTVSVLTTYTGNTPQTGDVYVVVNSGTFGNAAIKTETAAIKVKTDGLPSDPADASDIAAAFSTVNATLATIAGYIDTEVGTIITNIAAVKVDTAATLALAGTTGVVVAAASKTGYTLSTAGSQALIELCFTYDATATYATANAGSLVAQIADNAGGSSLTVQDIVDGIAARPWTANGYATLTLDATVTTGDESVYPVHVLPDGSILAAGSSFVDLVHLDRHLILRYTPNGQLDPTFGATAAGYTLTSYDAHGGPAAMVVQADGKIVVGGSIYNEAVAGGTWGQGDLDIARYTPNGAFDATYGTAGHTVTSITQDDQIWGLVLQADGKTVFGGWTYTGNAAYDFLVGRYTTAGILDTSWNTVGYTVTNFGGTDDRCYSIAMQSRGANAGKVVAAGFTGTLLVSYNAALSRYTTAGVLDSTFGTAGKTTTDLGGSIDWWLAVAVQPADDKILTLGLSNTGPGGNYVFAVARYSANGVLDATFGTAGVARFTIGDGSGASNSAGLIVQPDGKIVFGACYADVATSTVLGVALARLDSAGVLDPTFNPSGAVPGVVLTKFGGTYAECNSITLQPDGKIMVGGRKGLDINGAGRITLVARFNPDGTPDDGEHASSLIIAADQILGRLGVPDLADHARQSNIIGAGVAGLVSGATAGATPDTLTFKGLDQVTTRLVSTADQYGNRTIIVTP